jgi:two-component system, OmpR family, phosphate regulon response regulator PhoB
MKLSKLLLVEDNQDAADLVITILEYAGHKVIHKTTGQEGLEAAQSEQFDGILLDYMLPDMDGTELCRMLRKIQKEIPIILTSAHVNRITPDVIEEIGATTFVPKPISQNIVKIIGKYVENQSLARLEERRPDSVVKRFLGPYIVDGKG